MYGPVNVVAHLMCAISLFYSVSCTDYCLKSFPRCICTDENVECHSESKLTNGLRPLLPFIKDHAVRVVITGSDFRELPANVLGSCHGESSLVLWELKTFDLSKNRIRKIDTDSFNCMPNLETLVLAGNDWLVGKGIGNAGYFTSLPNLRHVNLNSALSKDSFNNRIVSQLLETMFSNTSLAKLEVLELANNDVVTFGNADVFCSMTSLRILDLSKNKIVTHLVASGTASKCLPNLEYLDLTFNKIPRLTKEFIEWIESLENLKSLRLGHNDYVCDCNLLETFDWLTKTDISVDHESIVCTNSVDNLYENKPILQLDRTALDCNEIPTNPNTVAVPDPTLLDCSTLLRMMNYSQASDNATILTLDLSKCYMYSGAAFTEASHVVYIALGLILAKFELI